MASKLNVRFYVGLIVVVLLIVSPAAFAQFTANIQGIVQDPSGAGLANAKVDLVNTATHVTTTTTADSSGNYRFGSLAPGAYSVTAEVSWLRQVPGRCDFADRADFERASHTQGRRPYPRR